MDVVDSKFSAVGTIAWVAFLVEADEGVGLLVAILVLAIGNEDTLDLTVLGEDFTELLFVPAWVEVLDKNVVEGLFNIVALLDLEALDGHAIFSALSNGSLGSLLSLEANETISVGDGRLCIVNIETLAILTLDDVGGHRNLC